MAKIKLAEIAQGIGGGSQGRVVEGAKHVEKDHRPLEGVEIAIHVTPAPLGPGPIGVTGAELGVGGLPGGEDLRQLADPRIHDPDGGDPTRPITPGKGLDEGGLAHPAKTHDACFQPEPPPRRAKTATVAQPGPG